MRRRGTWRASGRWTATRAGVDRLSRRGLRRLRFLLLVAGAAWLLLLGRGAFLALVRFGEIHTSAHEQQTNLTEKPAQRGEILDRTGRKLACSMTNESIALHLAESSDMERICRDLVRYGACTPERACSLAAHSRPGFQWVARHWVPPHVVRALRDRHPEIRLLTEMKRYHPAGPIAPNLLGIAGVDGRGLSGLEYCYDSLLSGRAGRMLEFVTGGGTIENAPPAKTLTEPQPGGSLVLTIDARMQEIVRHRLREGLADIDTIDAWVMLMNPWTGEILANCEEPSFDPLSGEMDPERLAIRAFSNQYEPGSTYKVVSLAAALEAGVISPEDSIDCLEGERRLRSCRIRDHKRFGMLTAGDVLTYSSNIGAGKIAELVGWEGCYRMAQDLGFGQVTGIGLGCETTGTLPHPLHASWSERSLITIAYGQEIACSALQLSLAFAAIANGGVLMKPLLVKAQLDAEGQVISRCTPEAVRRAMSPETAYTLRQILREVVVRGTGKRAEVSYFPPAGKTGTAQVFDYATGSYSPDEHVLSFIGFAPYENPRILCQVAVRCRGDRLHASDVAVPIFAQIIKDLVWLLEEDHWDAAEIPSEPERRITVPDVRGLGSEAARRALHRAGLLPVLDGGGAVVTAVRPQPYRAVPLGSAVYLSLGGPEMHGTVRVPEVRGLSLRQAISLLTEAGLRAGIEGSGWVTRQEPAAGSVVAPGSLCVAWGSPARSKARTGAVRRNALACQTR